MLSARILFGADPDPRPRSLEGLLVAVPRLLQHCDDAARRAVRRASALLARLGARIEVGTGPDLNPGQVRRLGLLACELGLLDEYDVEYRSGDTGLSPALRRLLDYADRARRDPHRIETLRSDLARLGEELQVGVESADLTLLPTTPGPVPALTEDPPTAADLTAWVNVAGLPAVSLPIGAPRKDFSSVQLIGRAGSDLDLLAHAAALGAVSREVPDAA
jgi:Asp-tRNA(Asn)/Glu-tRNA(Gln) amidotransferase A subunit family amidase